MYGRRGVGWVSSCGDEDQYTSERFTIWETETMGRGMGGRRVDNILADLGLVLGKELA